MGYKRYLDEDYRKAYLSLSNEQQGFLDNYVKTGYRTRWNYILARDKGLLLTIEDFNDKYNEEIGHLEQTLDWILIDYTDYLKRNRSVRCECGKALRHAFTVKDVPSDKEFILGRDHFIQYTSICPEVVKDIISNFKMIDLEKNEILGKVIENIDIDIIYRINQDYVIPKDMIKQIEVHLPLLDRQIKRLKDSGAFSVYQEKSVLDKYNYVNKYDGVKENLELSKISNNNLKPISFNISTKNKSLPKPDYEIDIQAMIHKLETKSFSLEDTEKYLKYLIYYEKSLNSIPINKEKIKQTFYRALGGLNKGSLRTNLVEIESILIRICIRHKL